VGLSHDDTLVDYYPTLGVGKLEGGIRFEPVVLTDLLTIKGSASDICEPVTHVTPEPLVIVG